VSSNFLGNIRAENYKELIEDMLSLYHKLGCQYVLKDTHASFPLGFFPVNCSMVSDEHGGRFHQEIATMEKKVSEKVVHHHIGRLLLDVHQKCS
jgi:hypothetical protein